MQVAHLSAAHMIFSLQTAVFSKQACSATRQFLS
jgi:hypothetical protein